MEPPMPRRPLLRPGARVVRRAGRLQVGTLPGSRTTLPDRADARAFLDDLAAARRPPLTAPEARAWAVDLLARGLVVDADELAGAMTGSAPREAVAAAFAQSGPEAATRLAARSATRVAVDARAPWGATAERLLAATGLGRHHRDASPDVVLVVEPGGEPPRTVLDDGMRTGTPHLLVRNLAGLVEVGPFVVPGLTACLRCVDAHRSDADPGHALVVEQHQPREGEPCDPLLLELALGWAVRDLVSFAEGDAPTTWSASVLLDHRSTAQPRVWTRHPRCGCCWGDLPAAG